MLDQNIFYLPYLLLSDLTDMGSFLVNDMFVRLVFRDIYLTGFVNYLCNKWLFIGGKLSLIDALRKTNNACETMHSGIIFFLVPYK